ncbi:Heterokaryon incompatibility protein (HET) domain containing protein [Rhypophila sp. PSN 637]
MERILVNRLNSTRGMFFRETVINLYEAHSGNITTGEFDLMKTWLRTCVTTHKTCGNVPSSPWLPTRLVDVSDLSKPRLVLSKDIPMEEQAPSYVTLSHRWTDDIVRLTTDKIFEFQNRIPAETLCQTFLDAFTVASQLGVGYIWIDSLCILQDSDYAWKYESTEMGRIYQNGFCNIAATAASFGKEFSGLLLKDRKPTRRSSAAFRIPIHRSHEQLMRSALFTASCDKDFGESWKADVERSPLNSRGWVFQERYLSPRTIHFASSEVFWECMTTIRSESTNNLPIASYDKYARSVKWWGRASGYDLHPEPVFRYSQCSPWCSIVFRYSYCSLTRESDRLMALAGVAQSVASSRDSVPASAAAKYLAGLWEGDLPQSLVWIVDHSFPTGPCSRSDKYRAPTWSWTSLDFESAEVMSGGYLDTGRRVPVVQVVDTQVIPQDGFNEFGPLVGGRILISGRTYPLNLAELPETDILRDPFRLYVDNYPKPKDLETVADVCLPIYILERSEVSPPTVGCLLLKQDERLLSRENGAEPGIGYVRVGVIMVFFEETVWDSDSNRGSERDPPVPMP